MIHRTTSSSLICWQRVRAGIALVTSGALVNSTLAGNIVPDAGAPVSQRPQVITTANGIDQVNIQTPSNSGVSMNRYSRLDVPGSGVVFNNSMTSAQTRLAGWVSGNPNVGAQGARIIVNQVNSSDPSRLNGYMEVAGSQAQVIVANPAGITCAGCGFINESRGTLTTGTSMFSNGQLTGYSVTQGQITIAGAGLDATTTDYTDIIARTVQVNAGIWARALKLTTGANQVDAGNTTATSMAASGSAPGYALDVAALGGMYANSIYLVGTESGVGMRSAGTLGATAGDLLVTSAGLLTNTGALAAQGDVQIQTAGITSSGQIGSGVDSASGKVTGKAGVAITSSAAAALSGTQFAAGGITVSATSVDLDGGSMQAGGDITLGAVTGAIRNRAGLVQSDGVLRLASASALDNTSGRMLAASNIAISLGADLTNARGIIQSGSRALASTLSVRAANVVNAAGSLLNLGSGATTLGAMGKLSEAAGGVIGGNGQVTIIAGSVSQTGGRLGAGADLTVTTNGQTRLAGSTTSGGNLAVVARHIALDGGAVSAAGNVNLSASVTAGAISNRQAEINAGGRATLQSATVDNTAGRVMAHGMLTLQAGATLTNASGLVQAGTGSGNSALRIAAGSLDNTGGQILNLDRGASRLNVVAALTSAANCGHGGIIGGNGAVDIHAGSVDQRRGRISSGSDLSIIAAGRARLAGDTLAGAGLTLVASTLALDGGTEQSGGSMSLSTGRLTNIHGLVQAGTAGQAGPLSVSATSLDNTAGQMLSLGSGAAQITVAGHLTNANPAATNGSGRIGANGALSIQAARLSNGADAEIVSGGALDVTSETRVTNNGLLATQAGSTAPITLNVPSLDNTGGSITADGNVTVTVAGALALPSSSRIAAGGRLALSTAGRFSNAGEATAQGASSIDSTGDAVNTGSIGAGGRLIVTAPDITNNATLVGASVAMNATGSIRNLGPAALVGATDPNGSLVLLAPDIENRDDTTATGTAPTTSIYGLGKLVLAGGQDGGTYTNAATIINSSGLLQSGGNMSLLADTVTNTRRELTTSGDYTSAVDAGTLAALGVGLSGQVGTINTPNPNQIGGVYVDPPHGGLYNSDYLFTQYTGTAGRNTITGISPAAGILVGGDLGLAPGSRLLNHWSNITAVGNIDLTGVSLDQNSWSGTAPLAVQVNYQGNYVYRTYRGWMEVGGFGGTPTYCFGYGSCKNPADVRTYAVGTYDSTLTAGGTIGGSGATINNPASNAGASQTAQWGGTRDGDGGVAALTGRAVSESSRVAGAVGGAGVTFSIDGASFSLPGGGLFHTNKSPTAKYLVESNPAFTHYQSWASSNYYFQLLGFDPNQIGKRLGDGMVEQQLVQSQLLAMTGQASLAGYGGTQSAYQALLTSGAAAVKSFNVAPGVALTPAQVAQLTSDVVIMVSQVVDGQTVLVPQVYLAPGTPTLVRGNGGLVAAGNVNLTALKGFTNGGTIQASQNLVLSGTTLDGEGGAFKAGSLLSLATVGDMNLGSAQISAGALALRAGGNLELSPVIQTQHVRSAAGGSLNRITDRQATSIDVKGDAQIAADGNVTANGVSATIGGNLLLSAAQDLSLGTAVSRQRVSQLTTGGHESDQFSQHRGTTLNVGGAASMAAGGHLSGTGAQLNLAHGGSIQAGGSVTLGAARDTAQIHRSGAGGSSGNSYTMVYSQRDDTVKGSRLASGGNLSITAGRDVNVLGSTVSSTGTLSVAAAGSVNVSALAEHHSRQSSWSGSSHHGFGSRSNSHSESDQSTVSVASALSGSNVSIVGAGDVDVVGSSISSTAAGKVSVTAGNTLNIVAAASTRNDQDSRQAHGGTFSRTGSSGAELQSATAQASRITGGVLQLQSGSGMTLQAAQIRGRSLTAEAGSINGQVVDPNATLHIDAAIQALRQSSSRSGHGLLTRSASGQGQIRETLRYTTVDVPGASRAGGPVRLQATGGIRVGASSLGLVDSSSGGRSNRMSGGPAGAGVPAITVDLKQQARQLGSQPGLAYLGQLDQRSDVAWQQVQLASQSWNYHHSGLTGVGAAIVAVAVAVATAGSASGLSTSLMTSAGATTSAGAGGASTIAAAGAGMAGSGVAAGTVLTTSGAAMSGALAAGISSLASQAAVSLANNGGDIGKTLQDLGSSQSAKNVVAAMLTAGVGQGLGHHSVGTLAGKTAVGCAAGSISGAGCRGGAAGAAIAGAAAWAYNSVIGYDVNAGPGKTPSAGTKNYPFYTPQFNGRQPVDSFGNNVIGLNRSGSIFSQGSVLSDALNRIPFVNAVAGVHDWFFNASPILNSIFPIANVPLMGVAAAVAIPAAFGNNNLSHVLPQRLRVWDEASQK